MKKIVLVLASVASLHLFAVTPQGATIAARQAYAAGNYKRATELYKSIPEKTPAIWYALGCCAYRGCSYAHACVMWQRARAQGADALVRQCCIHNELLAQKKLGLTTSAGWRQPVNDWFMRMPLFCVQLLFLLVWIVVLLTMYRRWHIKKIRKIFGVVLIGSVVVFGGALIYRYIQESRMYAVVVREEQVLYAGPGSDYPVRGHGVCGQTLVVQGRCGEWYKVITADGIVGWITRSSLMMVRP